MLRTQSKNMKNWSSSVDSSSSSVDTRDRFQKTFWKTWDSVSTLDQVPENLLENMGQCVDTRSGSVDTRSASQNFLGQTGTLCRH
ncbi:hypothetical protein Taro_031165 [Colocasia esculenta]|uniref:Uncharacterized protein n=1 Tax=Colocasia esculenta TaxID=4460 RepID=A0A843W5J6_COLES|nr:hypothetical protein [Colocasia esculenta]